MTKIIYPHMVLLISYLKRMDRDYTNLYKAIENIPGKKTSILTSTVIVETQIGTKSVFDLLSPYVDNNDNLFIVRITKDSYGLMPKEFWPWFNGLSF